MFNEFDGIGKAKKIVKQQKTTLDLLVEVGSIMVLKYHHVYDMHYLNFKKIYLPMMEELSQFSIFNEQDIISLIHINSINYSILEKKSISEKKVLGIYTAVLTDILTKRNKEIEKKTIITIEDAHFDYLFYLVQNADIISIQKSTGVGILLAAGFKYGNIKEIYLNNCEGNDLLFNAASESGKIETITLQNCNGDRMLLNAASESGKIGTITLQNCNGYTLLSYAASERGKIGTITLQNCNGDRMLSNVASLDGKIKTINLQNCESNSILEYAINDGRISSHQNKDEYKHIYGIIEIINLHNCIYEELFKDVSEYTKRNRVREINIISDKIRGKE